ncbi:hypothetical protein HK101_002389 [Irineochytrium annulatum]|nr:hypothetical protein HK101_002389 [Irineochytrium annulatum]
MEAALSQLKGMEGAKVAEMHERRLLNSCIIIQAWIRGCRVRKHLRGRIGAGRISEPMPDRIKPADEDIATMEEADLTGARNNIIERLQRKRSQRPDPFYNAAGLRVESNTTVARLMAAHVRAQRLLDSYYELEKCDKGDFVISPQDLSLGCRFLRKKTDVYLTTLLGMSP